METDTGIAVDIDKTVYLISNKSSAYCLASTLQSQELQPELAYLGSSQAW